MRETIINASQRVIAISFYLLFFFVPLFFVSNTFELFEFNKMWLTFGLTLIIGAAWFIKMIAQKKFFLQRTPLDIPILIFILSQVIATFHSLDTHISIWGYYSRFNGGLLSLITYTFLYYAFVSNLFEKKYALRLLQINLLSGLAVALWGLPSHFGHDPTCFLFRGQFDVSCWTAAFQPKIRLFSTLGQPDWLAAYLDVLLPISLAFFLKSLPVKSLLNEKALLSVRTAGLSVYYLLLSILFYIELVWTASRSGFIAFWLALLTFIILFVIFIPKNAKNNISSILFRYKYLVAVALGLAIITFFSGTPFSQLDKFTFTGLKNTATQPAPLSRQVQPAAGELGGTDSGTIRKYVWEGAIDAWKHNPIFGTGVETFAFAYYQYRPAAHNLTSEWDYLYNKAHNEYLNYLETTGAVGLITYLLMIGFFLFITLNTLLKNKKDTQHTLIILALLSGYFSILITNFFGFSVVMINVFLFIIPAFIFVLQELIKTNNQLILVTKTESKNNKDISMLQWIGVLVVLIVLFYYLNQLLTFWEADKAYALGYNLDQANEYQQAFTALHQAVQQRGDEPTFKDELTINDAVLASAFAYQKDATDAAKLTDEATAVSDQLVSNYPNNVVFWKTRVRVYYALSQINPQYLQTALDAIKKAHLLAPTDAKISYNMGLLYGQTNQQTQAIQTLKYTIKLKPNYRDAYYALGLFYHDAAIDKSGKVVNQAMQQNAVNTMKYLLSHVAPNDSRATQALKSWGSL